VLINDMGGSYEGLKKTSAQQVRMPMG